MARKGTDIRFAPVNAKTRKSKETKYGPKRGSTPPGNHSNQVKAR